MQRLAAGIMIVAVAALLAHSASRYMDCQAQGGQLVREMFSGYECAKVERIKP